MNSPFRFCAENKGPIRGSSYVLDHNAAGLVSCKLASRHRFTSSKNLARRGQAMLLAILAIGGMILGATTVAGTITLYQIRASEDFRNSAASIFAADTGVSWALYSYMTQSSLPNPSFANGTENVQIACYDSSGSEVSCANSAATHAVSKGTANNTKRAFSLDITTATTTFP